MTTNKRPTPRPPEPPKDVSSAESLKTAYEIHTLAQLLYARMAAPAVSIPVPPPVYH